MKNLFYILIGIVLLSSCNEKEYKQADSGLKYKFFKQNKKAKAMKEGDIATFKMKYYINSTDSLLLNTDSIQGDFKMKMKKNTYTGGSFEDGILIMHLGDSIEFLVDAKNLFEKTINRPLPKYIKKGELIRFDVKLENIQTQEEIQAEQKTKAEENKTQESQLLQDYIKDNSITVKPTQSGLYIIFLKHGTGAKTIPGKKVTVDYTGTLLNGKKFDSSVDRKKPFSFPLGGGKVIPAWDETVAMLRVGDKVRILAPSYLAYGEKGYPGVIPPYSTLVFDIEVLSVGK